ncbi:MAG: RNA 3'-terminal phosphate cyclase [Desulfobacteraceae bacterium]|nr:MAG: RNA 3'-terminal phosphate cyclase [Desulfobacteraceae bacterium]
MITIDGSFGEGGGQILRSALALALITGKPFRMVNIRAKRKKGGLLRQHLTALQAAMEIGQAQVEGGRIGSPQITFEPGPVVSGEYRFAVGTAGSATLVLQTVLPALMIASGETKLVIEGGTHNPYAPPFDFLQKAFLPCIAKMGPQISCMLDRAGFYPAGGGRISVAVRPCSNLKGLHLLERGDMKGRQCLAMVSKLDPNIGHREIKTVREKMDFQREHCGVVEVSDSAGPGNILVLETAFTHITEVFTGFGEAGKPAEQVAEEAIQDLRQYLAGPAPVGRYLADQLLLPLAMAGQGSFRTLPPTQHTLTNIEVVKRFLDIPISCQKIDTNVWEITVGR